MNKDDAKKAAYTIWKNWGKRKDRNNMIGLEFHSYLQSKHSHLLTFRCNGDRYQVVNSWVTEWKRFDKIHDD